jgi:hypothetical protein
MQSNDHAALTASQDQAVKGQDQEIHEDDRYVDYNLNNLDTLSINKEEEKYEEEESWEEYDAQTKTTTNDDQIQTSRWGKDWNEEENEEIRKMNQRSTRNEDGNKSTEQDTSLAVPDSPWSSENMPLPEDYRPWPENPPSRPEPETKQQAEGMRTRAKPPPLARESTGRVGRNQRVTRQEDEDEGTEQDTSLSGPVSPLSTENTPWPEDCQPLPENPQSRPEPETEQQAEGMRTRAKPPPPARESTGRAGRDQRKLPPARRSTGQANDDEWEEPLMERIKQLKGMTMATSGLLIMRSSEAGQKHWCKTLTGMTDGQLLAELETGRARGHAVKGVDRVQGEEDDEGPFPAKNSALTEEYPPLKPRPPARKSTGRAERGQH